MQASTSQSVEPSPAASVASCTQCFIDIARIVRGIGSMKRHGVRPSVSPIHPLHRRAAGLLLGQAISTFPSSHHSAAAHRCCGFAAVGPAGRRYLTVNLYLTVWLDEKKTNFKKKYYRSSVDSLLISIVFSSE